MEIYKLYDGEVELKYLPGKHMYMVGDEIIYGVTSVTGVIDKSGGLLPWAVGRAVEYLREKLIPGVPYDEIQLHSWLEEASKQHRIFKQKAADVGTMVHAWLSDYISGKNPPMPINESLKAAISAFLQWVKENEVKFTLTEQKIYSREHKYAGTLDAEGYVRGELGIIDFKTSKAIYDEMRFQVAAYQQARQEETGTKYGKRWILRLGKELNADGTLDFEPVVLDGFEEDIKAFLGALEIKKRLMYLKDKKFGKIKV